MTNSRWFALGFGLGALAVILMLAASKAAHAQKQCGPHALVVASLNGKYQEGQRAAGLINEKAMMEIFVSAKGTWTLIVTNDRGMTCVLAAGEAWEDSPPSDFKPGNGI